MKVFFIASIAGKEKYLDDYKLIIETTKKLGHDIFSDHIVKSKCNRNDLKLKKDYRKYFQSIKNLLSESDVVIAEVSFPSLMVGFVLHMAIQQRKNVLVLFKNNPHRILIGDSSNFLTLRKYESHKHQKVEMILKKFFLDSENKSLNIRFNLMIDETVNKILEKKSKKENISKADYIRKLIENNINNEL